MKIKCKAPQRWALRCKTCGYIGFYFTHYPGKNWPNDVHETGVKLFRLPGIVPFQNYFDCCPKCSAGRSMGKKAYETQEIISSTITVGELQFFLKHLNDTVTAAKKAARMVNMLRCFIEVGKVNKSSYDELYKKSEQVLTALQELEYSILKKELPDDFGF